MSSRSSPVPAAGGARPRWARFALPLVVVSLLIGLTAVVGYRSLSEEIRNETHRTLAVIAEQKRQQIEDMVGEVRVDGELHFSPHSQLTGLFGRWLEQGRHDDAILAQMRGLVEEAARLRAWDGLALLDAGGQVVLVVGEADIGDRAALIEEVLRRPRIESLDLHLDARGHPQFGVLAPVAGADGKLIGVAYLSRRADRSLYPLVQSWPVPTSTAETYLVRRDADAVRFLSPLRHRQDTPLAFSRPLATPDLPAARAVQGQHGILAGGRDYRGVGVLAYAAAVAGTPWLVLAEIDEREAYAGIRSMAWAAALAAGAAFLLLYFAGYQLWRREREHQELAALEARQAAEARFRVIFEQAPLGVVLLDSVDGRITETNQRYCEIVGRSAAALAGLDPNEITHPDDVGEGRQQVAQLRRGEIAGYRLNKRYLRPDGSVVWASLTCAPVQVQDEAAPRFLVIVEDITARRRIEERLRISEERHRLLADNAIDVILTMDVDGRLSYVSPSVAKLRGVAVEATMRERFDEMLAPASRELAQRYFASLRASLGAGLALPQFRDELEWRCADGGTVWTEVTASPLLGADGSFVEILGVVRDISERKRYEDRLRQAYDAAEAANAAKSEFLAHMSHEIRTPMNAVLGLAQVLEREALADNQREMVARIRSAGQSLLAILNDVLDLSKIEAGQLRLECRPFELAGLLANVDSLMGQTARAKGLVLRTEAAPEALVPLLGDGLRLEQVLFNLTGNAIKFTERGEVVLRVRVLAAGPDRLRLRFEVSDTGIGIGADAQARLFAPFAQADGGISRRFGGTGLGLSICKRLLELMDGEIGVVSQPGEGSTFWFELPLARAGEAAPAAAAVTAPSAGPRLRGAHLLVVDDSAMNRDLVERALALEGAGATLAADGLQALQMLAATPERFDAVLMDVQMPVMDGLTAMRQIRGELGLIDLPIIAFTAGVRDEQQAAARASGANDVLPKPMDLEQMAVMLARWLRPSAAPDPVPVSASVSAPVATDGSEFPDIPGIDRERAAQRLGRDRSMFLSLLQMFAEDNADAVELARRELAAGDREAAGRRLHTLASNAGFLCALDLMASARELEEAIDRGRSDVDEALAALGDEVAALIAASQPWLEGVTS